MAPEKIKRVVHMTLHEKPPNATHWSMRSMARAAGISYSSVQRIWHAHGLKPHLVETFKISRDKNFAAKVEDVVGLYLNPPDKALVLCVDEKSQIQALDRTQPGLPMVDGKSFRLADEVRYIQRRAADHTGRVIGIGQLILFSSKSGDAWLLDPSDQLAARLARDGDAEPIHIDETDTTFAIGWKGHYRIDGPAFIYVDRDTGRISTILGYPTHQLTHIG